MGTFVSAFKPALNKEGYAKLTFLGTGTQSGVKNEGTEQERLWELFKLVFEIQGVVRGNNQKVSITSSYTYDEDSTLGKALKAMGFKKEASELQLVEDEDGFGVSTFVEDTEGFEVASESVPDIEGFLEGCKGIVFIGKVQKGKEGKSKGFWEIDVDTLKPFVRNYSAKGIDATTP